MGFFNKVKEIYDDLADMVLAKNERKESYFNANRDYIKNMSKAQLRSRYEEINNKLKENKYVKENEKFLLDLIKEEVNRRK